MKGKKMKIYKVIFWYNPTEKKLIVKKVACDHNGVALEPVEYSSKSGDNFNHKAEWAKLSRGITGGHPYNYYPRGRVEVKNNKATVYFHPILNEPRAIDRISEGFGLYNGTILVREVPDGSDHYKYLIDYPVKVCNMCGKTFDFWDNQEKFCFEHYIGYGSKHDLERIRLNLCCDCFDKVINWILPQCKHDPMSEYR